MNASTIDRHIDLCRDVGITDPAEMARELVIIARRAGDRVDQPTVEQMVRARLEATDV